VSHRLEYAPAALDDLRRMHPTLRQRAWERIQALADDPRPPNCEALKGGLAPYLKIRAGDHRIVYSVEPDGVFIARVGHRRSIYKELSRS
jgi:mRNA interferase RelE/StbE